MEECKALENLLLASIKLMNFVDVVFIVSQHWYIKKKKMFCKTSAVYLLYTSSL